MSIIKPKRGTGSPAGSIVTNEIAMDTAAKILYVSTDGTNAVNLADDTRTYLTSNFFLQDFFPGTEFPYTIGFGYNKIKAVDSGLGIELQTGAFGPGTPAAVKINASALDLLTNPIINVQDPTNAQDGATKAYVDTTSGLNLPLAGGTMTGDIDLNSNDIDMNGGDITGITETVFPHPGGTMPTITWRNGFSGNMELNVPSADQQDNGIWFNYGTQYLGQVAFKRRTAGNHQFRLATWDSATFTNLPILNFEKYVSGVSDGWTVLTNGSNDANLTLERDKATLTYRLDIQNGRTNSGSGLSSHALFCDTDMTQDLTQDIINSATFNVSYGANTIRNGIQNAVTFSAENDALGTKGVGKFQAIYNANGYESKMRLQSINEAGSGSNAVNNGTTNTAGNGQIEVTAVKVASNVPYQLPQYTVAQLGAIPNPQEAMLVYNADTNKMAFYNGTAWTDL